MTSKGYCLANKTEEIKEDIHSFTKLKIVSLVSLTLIALIN